MRADGLLRTHSPSPLPQPPPGVFPPPAPAAPQSSGASSAGTSTTATGGSSTPAAGKPQTLIDRFGLHARLPSPSPSSSSSSFASLSSKGKERATADDADAGGSGAIKGNAAKWEASADAREASLTRRKEEMVLEARRCVPLSPCSSRSALRRAFDKGCRPADARPVALCPSRKLLARRAKQAEAAAAAAAAATDA